LAEQRILATLSASLVLFVLLLGVTQVSALSIVPSTPIAGQAFVIDSGATIAETINVYGAPGCVGAIILSGKVPAGGGLVVPGQSAGQYSTDTNFEIGCLNFTVMPQPITG